MGSTTVANDLVYDLVSIQYHALQGAQVSEKYLQDASGNEECSAFIKEVKEQDNQRAQRAHELLAQLTKDGIG